MTEKELVKLLKQLTKEAKTCSEGYIYLRSDGKILFDRQMPELRGEKYIVAGHFTPLKNFGKKAEEEFIDIIYADEFGEIRKG